MPSCGTPHCWLPLTEWGSDGFFAATKCVPIRVPVIAHPSSVRYMHLVLSVFSNRTSAPGSVGAPRRAAVSFTPEAPTG